MESIIILIIIGIAFFLGRWDGRSEFKKHEATVIYPENTPEHECHKSLMTKVEADMVFQGLIDLKKGDGVVQNSVEFYVKRKP